MKIVRVVSKVVIGALLVLAAVWVDGQVLPVNAQPLKKVTLRLAYQYNGHRSPYLLGKEKGFYAEEGLDVEVREGTGVSVALQLLASGQDTFAVVDPPSLMLGVAQGMPVKQVAQLYQTSPNAVVVHAGSGIKTPRDLVGKVITSVQGDTTTTMLVAMLNRNGVNPSDVRIVAMDGPSRIPPFLNRQVHAVTAYANDSYLSIKAQEPNVEYFLYSDFGVNTMGDGIATSLRMIEQEPEVVRAFVRATIRAYEYALEHPEEAIEALLKVAPARDAAIELEKLKATAPFVRPGGDKSFPVGYSTREQWEDTERLMLEFGGLSKKARDVDVYFTNEFLPY